MKLLLTVVKGTGVSRVVQEFIVHAGIAQAQNTKSEKIALK
jgi:hypothetical protein